MTTAGRFASEAELVAKFIELVEAENGRVVELRARHPDDDRWGGSCWTVYPETCGFDLVLVNRETGMQIGIEAKLSLNAKALCQAVQGAHEYHSTAGPDYRAVLVPGVGKQAGMGTLAAYLGVTVITVRAEMDWDGKVSGWRFQPDLPDGKYLYFENRCWYPWVPGEPMKLPAYVPDTVAGVKSPHMLTQWKIAAIKLLILLDRRGYVTRRDMKALEISPTRWCDRFYGYLVPDEKNGRYTSYVAGKRTPDFKSQHPRNWAEIEDDWEIWSAGLEDLP